MQLDFMTAINKKISYYHPWRRILIPINVNEDLQCQTTSNGKMQTCFLYVLRPFMHILC